MDPTAFPAAPVAGHGAPVRAPATALTAAAQSRKPPIDPAAADAVLPAARLGAGRVDEAARLGAGAVDAVAGGARGGGMSFRAWMPWGLTPL
jgi:hypothetical protein